MKKRENPISSRIAENICLFRRRFRYTQARLGATLKVDPDTVRGWEACRRRPDEDTIFAMSELHNLEGGWLWFYQDHSEDDALETVAERPASELSGSAVGGLRSLVTEEEKRIYDAVKMKADLGAPLSERESRFLDELKTRFLEASGGGLSFCPPALFAEVEEEKTVISAALGVRAAFLQDQRKAG